MQLEVEGRGAAPPSVSSSAAERSKASRLGPGRSSSTWRSLSSEPGSESVTRTGPASRSWEGASPSGLAASMPWGSGPSATAAGSRCARRMPRSPASWQSGAIARRTRRARQLGPRARRAPRGARPAVAQMAHPRVGLAPRAGTRTRACSPGAACANVAIPSESVAACRGTTAAPERGSRSRACTDGARAQRHPVRIEHAHLTAAPRTSAAPACRAGPDRSPAPKRARSPRRRLEVAGRRPADRARLAAPGRCARERHARGRESSSPPHSAGAKYARRWRSAGGSLRRARARMLGRESSVRRPSSSAPHRRRRGTRALALQRDRDPARCPRATQALDPAVACG